jgi:uncharacterized membrane protein
LAARLSVVGLTILACALLVGELASIVAITTGVEHLYDDARALTGLFCHQLPSRCPWFDGRPTVLCFRCVGLYSGIVSGPALPHLRNLALSRVTAIGVIAVLPSLLEVLIDRLIGPGVAELLRWVTGFMFGFGFITLLRLPGEKPAGDQTLWRAPA